MTPVQLILAVGILVVSLAIIVGGVVNARRELQRREPGTTIPGVGIGIALWGVAGLLFGIDLARALTLGWDSSLFGRWGFLPPTQPGNALDSFFGSPVMGLVVLGILTFFLGVPSATQLREVAGRLASRKTRGETLLTGTGIVVLIGLCVVAAWFVYSTTGSILLGMLAFFGSFVVQAAVIIAISLAVAGRGRR